MPNPEEYRRTCRVIDLILRVANQPQRWTRRALAEHYELSEKQIDKDLLLVRHGLRMTLRHSPRGYYFERVAALPALALTLPEALALLLAARLGRGTPGVPAAELAAALSRLGALLPPELAPLAATLAANGTGSDRGHPPSALLMELQMAIARRSRVRILYHSASREGPATDRAVDPYTLIPHLGSWYLVAMCHHREEVRIFKVDRIREMVPTGEGFEFPERFDLGTYMGSVWGLLRGEAGEPEDVVLEFEPEAGRWVRDQEWHPEQRVEGLPDGRVRLSFCLAVTSDLRRFVLGFGRQVRVVSPPSLAAWVMAEARGMAEAAGLATLSSTGVEQR